MNILVIDRAPPCDLLQGNALIGQHLFSRLRHHHLTIICPAPASAHERYQVELAPLFDTIHLVPREQPIPALMGSVEPALARAGLGLGGAVDVAATRAFQARVRSVVAAGSFDVIHTRQLPMAAIAADVRHPAKLLELIDSETLQASRRVRAKSPQTWLRATAARLVERRAVRRFNACTTVADADAQVIRRLAPGVPVHVTPNGVDADYFAPLELPEQPETIIFTGAMSFPPNVTAVLHFYHNILPLIRAELPNVQFIIAGRNPAPSIAALAQDQLVTVTGFVDDMRPWLARASLMVCPMVMGSGIKNKVLEALAMARPVVATTMGVEALDVINGHELAIADTTEEFAAATLALLRDSGARSRMGAAGRELVLRKYTWDACAASYDAIYSQLAARHGSSRRVANLRDKAASG
ncbi:MAG TPA: glycosyltransferase family 4 protein [Roseiflexaceae bacterium]|nr:glycosyltransferase family 4 protein [Roseiflexaceae bacterium]